MANTTTAYSYDTVNRLTGVDVSSRLTVHQSFAAKAHHDCATNLHPSRAGVHS